MSIALQASPFAAIMNAVVARAALALGIGTEYVRPVANDDYAVTETENLFAYLRPYGPSPVDPKTGQPYGDYGAGRYARVIGRRIRLYIYTRSGEDVVGGDEIALGGNDVSQTVETPPSMPGQFIAEEIVLNAMDDWTPPSPTGTALTIGPIHWVSGEGGPPERKREDEEGLIRSYLDFQAVYVLAITAVEPMTTALPVPITNN